MRVYAIFTDGFQVDAPSFAALEDVLRADPWNPSKHEAFRREMAQRAIVWSGTELDREKSSEAFLYGLEMAGMLRLEVEGR